MNTVQYFLIPLSPVLAPLAAGLGLIGLECVRSFRFPAIKWLVASAGLVASLVFSFWLYHALPLPEFVESGASPSWLIHFVKSYQLDATTLLFYGAISAFTLLSLFLGYAYFSDQEINSEVIILLLFICTGMMLLASAHSLLVLFLALELLSLPTYTLVGILRHDRQSSEAALKYFLFGSFATVLLVLGIALLYAQSGTLEIPKLSQNLHLMATQGKISAPLVWASFALLLVAGGFKVGLVPFHMWLPDVYQGAPTPITAFMGSTIKIAGFALVLRLLWGVFLSWSPYWVDLVNALAVLTMFSGNLAALVQNNLKRLFAYSSIAHAGYLMLGVTSIAKGGPVPDFIFFYLVVYALMFLGFFSLLLYLDPSGNIEIERLSGVGYKRPWLGACLSFFALSAAGLPPTAGFFGKYFLFLEASRASHTAVVALALVSSVIGLSYYLRILAYLYFREPAAHVEPKGIFKAAAVCAGISAVLLILFSLFPQMLI